MIEPLGAGGGGGPSVNGGESGDVGLVPWLLDAVALHVYVRVLVSPVTVIGIAMPDWLLATPPSLEVHPTL